MDFMECNHQNHCTTGGIIADAVLALTGFSGYHRKRTTMTTGTLVPIWFHPYGFPLPPR